MENIQLLFDKNVLSKKKGKNLKNKLQKSKQILLKYYDKTFSLNTVKKIIEDLESLKDCNRLRLPVILLFEEEISIIDKLSVVVFECVCYHMLKRFNIIIYWDIETDIITEGIEYSPLMYLSAENYSVEKFKDNFLYPPTGTVKHYRKVIKHDKVDSLSGMYSDILNRLKQFDIDDNCVAEISEVVSELIGNACEHAHSDCLVDLDVADNYTKKDSIEQYYGVNIAIINFSEILIGDALEIKINTKEKLFGNRYQGVEKALEYHKRYFDEKYTKDYFYTVSVFQDKISGRDKTLAGGTGLTKLIESLQERSEADRCYVISGDICLLFRQEYLKYDKDKWIGFNEMHDYLSDLPSSDVILKSPLYIAGTAYNLNFIMKRKADDEIC